MLTLPLRSFPLKEMDKMQIRLSVTLSKIFGTIAGRLLSEIPEPFRITERDIENNGTRKPKTLRVLDAAGVLPRITRVKGHSSWSSDILFYDYEDLFNTYAKDYEVPYNFSGIPHEVKGFIESDSLYHGFDTTSESLNSVGYYSLNQLQPGNKIYIYYHYNLFDVIIKGRKGSEGVEHYYPKDLLESRKKAVLKAVMKKYCEEDILSFIHKTFNMDLTGQSQSLEDKDVEFSIDIRSFHRHPATFSSFCFDHAFKPYTKEYEEIAAKINFEFNRLKEFKQKIDTAGGCHKILNDYIRDAVDNLVAKSVTLMAGDEEAIDALNYILDNRDIISYDYLYND